MEFMLTPPEVANLLGVDEEIIDILISNEGLPAERMGGEWKIPQSKVQQWIAERL